MAKNSNVDEQAEEFNFSFGNFRAMGFQYSGVVEQCEIIQPKEATYTIQDKKTGETRVLPSKPQLHMLIKPTDHDTKTGNPYPQYFTLTQNIRSKLGIFVEHLQKLGIDMGIDPTVLVGKAFEFEVKEVQFGNMDPVQVTVPIAVLDDLDGTPTPKAKSTSKTSKTSKSKTDDIDLAAVADALNGQATGDAIAAVAATFGSQPKVVAGVADGTLISTLQSEGLLTEEDGSYVRTDA